MNDDNINQVYCICAEFDKVNKELVQFKDKINDKNIIINKLEKENSKLLSKLQNEKLHKLDFKFKLDKMDIKQSDFKYIIDKLY